MNRPVATVVLALEDATAIETLEKLLAQDPSLRIVAFYRYAPALEEPEIIPDDQPSEAVLDAFDAVSDLKVAEVLTALRSLAAPRPIPIAPAGAFDGDMRNILSARELEIVGLIAEGLSNKEISARLSRSEQTVKNHVSHMLAKLHLRARKQLATLYRTSSSRV